MWRHTLWLRRSKRRRGSGRGREAVLSSVEDCLSGQGVRHLHGNLFLGLSPVAGGSGGRRCRRHRC